MKFLATALLLLLLPVSVLAAQVGTISGVKGSVQFRVRNNIPYATLAKGTAIAEGNWIKTGRDGWVELTLNDKSKFVLSNNTEFAINHFLVTSNKREGTFNLTQGKLRASVVKLAGKQGGTGLTVRSGTSVAGIKGTEFMMLSQGPANVFFGNEGTVAVSGNGSGPELPLTANTMTQNTRSMTPLEPLKVETGTPIAEARDIFDKITAATPPAEWTDSGKISEIIARWNINHASYLADSGKYNDALHVFQIALDLTTNEDIRSDAHLARGAVYARYLGNVELALAEYLLIMEQYPGKPQAETALFNTAQALADSGFVEQAKKRFEQYLHEFPNGKHRSTAETLLKNLGK